MTGDGRPATSDGRVTDENCTNGPPYFADSDTISGIPPGSKKSYILHGLEKGTEYSITINAILTQGRTEKTITASTETAG